MSVTDSKFRFDPVALFDAKNEEIESLAQQLTTSNSAYEIVQKDCWNLTEKVIPNLRQQLAERDKQVTLLRDAIEAEVRGARDGRRKMREALAATDPNQQQSRSFTDPVTDDDFLHMIDESNFAQERE